MKKQNRIQKLILTGLAILVTSGLLTALMNIQPALASVSWNF